MTYDSSMLSFEEEPRKNANYTSVSLSPTPCCWGGTEVQIRPSSNKRIHLSVATKPSPVFVQVWM